MPIDYGQYIDHPSNSKSKKERVIDSAPPPWCLCTSVDTCKSRSVEWDGAGWYPHSQDLLANFGTVLEAGDTTCRKFTPIVLL
jgi:hypothetical protein